MKVEIVEVYSPMKDKKVYVLKLGNRYMDMEGGFTLASADDPLVERIYGKESAVRLCIDNGWMV